MPQEGAVMGLRSRLYALAYDPFMSAIERAGLAAARAELLAAAGGRVLEIGAGTGLNLPHYPASVTDVIATEPDAAMSRRLERAAARTSLPVRVLRAPAEDIPYDDATFDTVVSTLVLCSVDDQPRSVRELWRVLKPGGASCSSITSAPTTPVSPQGRTV
jgi:ubiquinone/menaquinone biosynthesis C-methylase UbiE